MTGVEELLLVDGSETGESVPLRPLIIPERKVDFIIAYDAGVDAEYNWVNGTNLIGTFSLLRKLPRPLFTIINHTNTVGPLDTSHSAAQLKVSFPRVPSARKMVDLNLTTYPTFFGCNATSGPLVLYLPQTPWSGYLNFGFMQSSFNDNQFDQAMNNAFNIAAYGNGSKAVEANVRTSWPVCLACGVIQRSLARVNMSMPDVCKKCFSAHCWNGGVGETPLSEGQSDKRPILNPRLSYQQWNQTWYA